MENSILKFDPSVFVIGRDYQIIFLTETKGLGFIEIDGVRYCNEEGGLIVYDSVHKICVPGEALDKAGKYTVVFVEYLDKKPYSPVGVEKIRKEYNFYPLGENFRLFQFADTHARVETPLELYLETGNCDIILLNGDINEHSYVIENFYTSFKLVEGAVHGERPVIYSRGNHDTRGYAAQYLFDYIPTAFRDGRRETFYSFRSGSLWGLVLDCGEDKLDTHLEYGGTVEFSSFRRRQTEYIKSLIKNKAEEYEAEGVKHKIAFCHMPFTEHHHGDFDIENETYDEWVSLLNEIGIDLLLCGHMHQAYFIPANAQGERFRAANFPTAVCSIPARNRDDGSEYYTGGVIKVEGNDRVVKIIPDGDEMKF